MTVYRLRETGKYQAIHRLYVGHYRTRQQAERAVKLLIEREGPGLKKAIAEIKAECEGELWGGLR